MRYKYASSVFRASSLRSFADSSRSMTRNLETRQWRPATRGISPYLSRAARFSSTVIGAIYGNLVEIFNETVPCSLGNNFGFISPVTAASCEDVDEEGVSDGDSVSIGVGLRSSSEVDPAPKKPLILPIDESQFLVKMLRCRHYQQWSHP
jgi:hypothetical protein